MSTIRCIYEKEPGFPATDQHPDAVRYQVGGKVVDAIGGQPTQAEVDAVLNPPKTPDNATAQTARLADKSLTELSRAIDAGDTTAALRLVQSLLQGKS